jgi:replication factor A1
LNTFLRDWIIKARVCKKSPLRDTSKGGHLFNIELIDSHSTQIKCTFFNSAALKFYDQIEENKVYTFSDGQVKMANKRYSTLDNDFEVFFSNTSKIMLCDDDKMISK